MDIDLDTVGGDALPPDAYARAGQLYRFLLDLGILCVLTLAVLIAYAAGRYYLSEARRVETVVRGNAAARREEVTAGGRKKRE